ncbi:MAG: rhodanese-like domain-containing protein [Gemmobacter sp.]
MSRAVQQMLAEANAAVPRIDAAAAQALISQRGVLLLGIRDAPELEKTGRADPASPFHDPAQRKDRPVLLHCASGGRAALAGKLLRDMGHAEVLNLGGLKDWKDGGGPVVEPVDQGM